MPNTIEFKPIDFESLSLEDFENKVQQYEPEPILLPNPKRFVLFPIQYNDLWEYYKNMESKFWTAEEIELHEDIQGFNNATGKYRSHIVQICTLLCINQNLIELPIPFIFSNEIQLAEARCFFGFQGMQQNVHSELFTLILERLLVDQDEYREDTIEICSNLPSLSRKKAWVERYITESNDHFSQRLVAYIIYLSMFQNALDHFIFYITGPEMQSIMPGLVHAMCKAKHDRISFKNFYLAIYNNHTINKVPENIIRSMISETISIERDLIQDISELSGGSLANKTTPIDFDLLKMKSMAIGDQVCKEFNLKPTFGGKDPLPWMNTIYDYEMKKGDHLVSVVLSTPKKQKADVVDFTLDDDF
ncbi:ferritin-like superfamily [Globomyces pollinis-pini]|nr:ferritin-like superfamily [Globomyces pollinis-pini]KAJ2992267.1 Ribonucleoside-diphosphate reductase subunit M2 B [Globomyces sp. JEL0801]KAJ2992270.1 Ribonucleoside-diphosphate reductase subunit M2 B [Globomyces sp. JEL0801]